MLINWQKPLAIVSLLAASLLWAADESWTPANIPPAARQAAAQHQRTFYLCLERQSENEALIKVDFRQTLDLMIQYCNPKLDPISQAFAAYNAPDQFVEKFLKKTRHQAVRHWLPILTYRQLSKEDGVGK